MRDFAKRFYRSSAWRETRDAIFRRDFGLCVRCGRPGEIVHHKVYLTPQNIGDPDITLSADNLETLCRECHALEHEGESLTGAGLMFDEYGMLVKQGGEKQE